MEDIFIIGVAGGTGSGKTTVVDKVLEEFSANELCVISQDSYYKANDGLSYEERSKTNFDHPNSIDFDLLVKHLDLLKQGKTIEQPIYSFVNHNRTKETKTTKPQKVIIIEGILIFNNKKLRDLCDVKIFVHADDDERLIRRVRRDIKERGRDVEEVLSRYQDTLKPMHAQFIEPTKVFADIIIPNDRRNKVAIDVVRSVIKERYNEYKKSHKID